MEFKEKSEYSQKGKEVIKNFLIQKSRLECQSDDLKCIECFEYTNSVKMNIQFYVEGVERTEYGKITSQKELLIYEDEKIFLEKVEEFKKIIKNNKELFNQACNQGQNLEYGELKEEKEIYKDNVEIGYLKKCSICGGRGSINCSGCGGSGRRRESRVVQHGNESHTEYYDVSCPSCGGSGHVGCGNCHSTGWIATIITFFGKIKTIYNFVFYELDVKEFIKESLYKASFEKLKEYSEMKEISKNEIDNTKKRVVYSYNITTPYAIYENEYNGKKYSWIVYGKNYSLFDADYYLESILNMDLELLSSVLNKDFYLYNKDEEKVVNLFLESEINQDILEKDEKKESVENIVELLSRSLSKEYIEKTLSLFEKLRRGIFIRNYLFWLMIATMGIFFSRCINFIITCCIYNISEINEEFFKRQMELTFFHNYLPIFLGGLFLIILINIYRRKKLINKLKKCYPEVFYKWVISKGKIKYRMFSFSILSILLSRWLFQIFLYLHKKIILFVVQLLK